VGKVVVISAVSDKDGPQASKGQSFEIILVVPSQASSPPLIYFSFNK
jgi:hypothetical protein